LSFYHLGNARHSEQREKMERLEAAEICMFCAGPPAAPVKVASQHWEVLHNEFPYAGTRLHLLIVPRRHVTDLLDLHDEELAEFWQVARSIRQLYHLEYYGLGARCGDCRFTGGTIAHVHVHLIVGDVDDPGHTPVRLKLSSRPPDTGGANGG
jgi:ATP adenylyltransferase